MTILHSCCCWNNVRNGSLACGIFTLVLSCFNCGLMAYNLAWLDHHEKEVPRLPEQRAAYAHLSSARVWLYSVLTMGVAILMTSIVLIIGVLQDNRHLLIPWIISVIIMVFVDTAALIFQCVVFGVLTFNIILMVIWLGFTMLNVYCILCVISQYQELKAGRGTQEYLRRHRPTIIYHPGVQEVHITQGPFVMTYPGSQSGPPAVQMQPVIQTTIMMSPPSSYPVYSASTADGFSSQTAAEASGPEAQDQRETLLSKDYTPPPPYTP